MDNNSEKVLEFSKYEGAGNHFILVNNTKSKYPFLTDNQTLVCRLCDSNFGIGGNGLIELLPCKGYDYYMNFYTKNGTRGTMCGNGSRCALIYAYRENIIANLECNFEASDGPHTARIIETNPIDGLVEVHMSDVNEIKTVSDTDYFIDVGVPHYVRFVQDLHEYAIVKEGRTICDLEEYRAVGGINTNFAEWDDSDGVSNRLGLRTYQPQNHEEILACGTGAVAGALVAYWRDWQAQQSTSEVHDMEEGEKSPSLRTEVVMPGGTLFVSFRVTGDKFTDVWLRGPAKEIFTGHIKVH